MSDDPVVEENKWALRFRVSQNLLDFFKENGIRISEHNVVRWKPGDVIFATQDTHFHRHATYFRGYHVTRLGAFSYAFSDLNAWMQIGRYCSISWNVRLMGPQHPTNFVTSSEILYRHGGIFADTLIKPGSTWRFFDNPQPGPMTIGDDVWIGQDVLLRGGITIGTGAIVAAGAVVVKDVQPYEIVGGVPAKRIRYRFNDQLVQQLTDLEWWQYAIPDLPNLPWNDPECFVDALKRAIDSGEAKPFVSDLGTVKDVVRAVG